MAIYILATTSCPSGFTSVGSGSFLRGGAPGSGGSLTHTHDFDFAGVNSSFSNNINTNAAGYDTMERHYHAVPAVSDVTSGTGSSVPPYYNFLLCSKADYSDYNFTTGMIAMFDEACPSGWTEFTAVNGKLARAASAYGTYGAVHGHTVTPTQVQTNANSKYTSVLVNNTGSQYSSVYGHKHYVTTPASTSDSVEGVPPYQQFYFCKKN